MTAEATAYEGRHRWCGVTDGDGVCNLPSIHPGVVHAQRLDPHRQLAPGNLWAQWRSVLAGDEAGRGDHPARPSGYRGRHRRGKRLTRRAHAA